MRVCILGINLTSLTLAKALVKQKIYVDLYHQNKPYIINKTRTLGISKSNIDYFNKNIVNIEKIIWKVNRIEILTDNLEKEKLLNFDNNSNYLFSIVKNDKLLEILDKNLINNKYFKKKNFKIEKKFFENYNLVINTDYNNSITKKYFSKKIIKKYNSKAHTTIINHEKILNNIATQIFTKNGPLAFLPISNDATSVVYSVKNKLNQKTENIKDLINIYNPKYKINKIDQINSFDLYSLNLRSYYNGNILAFGDLLHKLHPFAGQGFNMTIRDVENLIRIINEKIDLGLPLDKSVNYEFEKITKNKNFIFSNSIGFINEFFEIERKTKNTFLSKSVQILGKNSILNKMFIKIADKGLNF
tara:strand:+ start:907 stop:1983 length:1077 start_codon:yes stop_codon:yes gene_type:complete